MLLSSASKRRVATTKGSLILVLALFLAGLTGTLCGQGLAGQISGSVLDPSGTAVVGAKVQLIHTATSQQRETTTDSLGNFIFTWRRLLFQAE